MRRSYEAEFRQLFDAQFASLYRYLDRLSGEPELAADLAQEAFVRLYQRGSLPDDPRAWLAAVASNLLRDERRRTARRHRILAVHPEGAPSGAAPLAPDEAYDAATDRARVRAALDALPERERRMLLLRHEGYSYREVAHALGIRETSVGVMLARATAAFRAAFGGRESNAAGRDDA
ncbi:MAG TPA: sigma-70 family RNA polymerase sigma factor [Gemmatimonadaceae bacterium]|nr:sigma-70 family RNA polymerase sigma factor [Gemmatimonadaceae bacterium]